MKALVIGGGLAGLTLAGRLSRLGASPHVVERNPVYTDAGYGIGLYRPGSGVFRAFGCYDEFLTRGSEIDAYTIADYRGRRLASVKFSAISEEVRPFVMAPRADLIDLLRGACPDVPITMGTQVVAVRPHIDRVEAVFDNGTSDDFDVVACCDGRNSLGRSWIPQGVKTVDTKWVYWTWWGPGSVFDPDALVEHCAPGWFLGAYPVPGKCMYGLGVPVELAPPADAPTEQVRAYLTATLEPLTRTSPAVAGLVAEVPNFYRWSMRDSRARKWHHGRIVLCGDAAATALPTAGVGASHAIHSAGVLAEELGRVGRADVPAALSRYAARCQRFVEMNVRKARFTARYSFTRTVPTTWLRDRVLERYPTERILDQLTKSVSHAY
ncbi:FAD-dependent oxidoreductase [Nocardia iowensis]|uniref:FAD-dependent monooxygenase n=1 Tax=Nocardia iowensis TaxID=204891 RepID=A0ABX8RUK5_NOCIO|nr:NAD(P)/FAD-dependent oxidoreductase [Nocardia iowensis]QXN93223.1 FAD-dependent monooxygenase [Nocardia iowensis]